MKAAFCILTCLLFMGFATKARTAEPSTEQQIKQADEGEAAGGREKDKRGH